MDAKTRSQKQKEAHKLGVTVTVGKNGITEATLDELDRHLRKHKLVKVRLLPAAADSPQGVDAQAEELAKQTGSTLIETRGGTAVFWRG